MKKLICLYVLIFLLSIIVIMLLPELAILAIMALIAVGACFTVAIVNRLPKEEKDKFINFIDKI